MHRFFVDKDDIEGEVVRVTGSDFNHISHSLRMQKGDCFIVNNGDGLDYTVKIKDITEEMVIAEIIDKERNRNETTINVTLAQAIPKKSNMDLIVQKCTEIGAKKIIPINTSRTIVKLSGKKLERRIDRWQKIAQEAAKQSRRGIIPEIKELINFQELKPLFKNYDLVLVPWEDEEVHGLREIWNSMYLDLNKNETGPKCQKEKSHEQEHNEKNILIIIGPEGGFSSVEIKFIQDNGGHAITLGPRILRTETAGLVALTAVLYQAGELGG
ncbi:MAG: 16S rRNA (uracil(1498)-N(3))-methyltransferase [Halanaerobiales bacterium]